MKRCLAAALLVVAGAACRDSALAAARGRDANKALCAAAHGIPRVLLSFHRQRIDEVTAMRRLNNIRELIEDNASGRYAAHLRDLAASLHVFEVTTVHRGDTSDAYRDLRALRESLPAHPACPSSTTTIKKKSA